MNLPHTEVKFYPEVKSQIGLSSLRISCKRALRFPQEISSPPPQMRMRPVNFQAISLIRSSLSLIKNIKNGS